MLAKINTLQSQIDAMSGGAQQAPASVAGIEGSVTFKLYHLPFLTPVISGIGCVEHKTFPFPFMGTIITSLNHKLLKLVSFEDMNGNILWKNNLGVSSVVDNGASIRFYEDRLSVTAEGAWTVMLYGSDGREVMRRKGYGESQIPLDAVGSGVYVARLQTANSAKTVKLIR